MKLFSRTTEYGIKAAIWLAANSKDGVKFKVPEISEAIQAPENYLPRILRQLVKVGIVESLTGPMGGFGMNKRVAQTTTMYEVVTALEGPDAFDHCVLGIKECNNRTPCPMHNSMTSIRDDIKRSFLESTLGDIAKSYKRGKTVLNFM